MINLPLVDENTCVFRNEEAIQGCVFCRTRYEGKHDNPFNIYYAFFCCIYVSILFLQ